MSLIQKLKGNKVPKPPSDGPEEWARKAREVDEEVRKQRLRESVGDKAYHPYKERTPIAEKLGGLEGHLIVVTNYAVAGSRPEQWQEQADKLAFGIKLAGFRPETPISFSIHFQEQDQDRARQFGYSASMLEKALLKQGFDHTQASEPEAFVRPEPLEATDMKTALEHAAHKAGLHPNEMLHVAVVSALGVEDQLGLDYFENRYGKANLLSGWEGEHHNPVWYELADSLEDTVVRNVVQSLVSVSFNKE